MREEKTIPRLYAKYMKEIKPELMKKMGYKNIFEAPRITKVVVNVGLGEGAQEFKFLEEAQKELSQIAGQHAVITRAKKAISNFKIRKGSPVGCKVTLRGRIMYEFLDRLVNITIPRIRDFKGLPPNAFDQAGNYTIGLTEQIIFPEIEYDKVQMVHGMDIVVVTNAKSKEASVELLKLMGFPFRS